MRKEERRAEFNLPRVYPITIGFDTKRHHVMKKILVVQLSLQPPGGGNVVAAWVIEALKQEHVVSVLTWTPIDLAQINHYCGTSLCESDFTPLRVARTVRALFRLLPAPLSLLKTGILLRLAKQITKNYELCISINNEADFGHPGIQYVHFPWAYQPRPPVDLRWYHGVAAVVTLYYWSCVRVAKFSFAHMQQNLTLVNSDWTGGKVRERHNIDSMTLYPPVPGVFPETSWNERENGFVCIGRIAPEKELEKVIDVLAAVRAQGHDVHLHIIGTSDNPQYYARIRRRAQNLADWLFLEENLSRAELVQMVARHRYGIHGMKEEHFGMAVAEMVRAGCIVFVPRGGGQTEIVGTEERLLYETATEAVTKIVRTLSDEDEQADLRAYLSTRKELFSTERFVQQIRTIVREFA